MNWYECPAENKMGLPMKIAIASRQELMEMYHKYSPGFFSHTALIEIVNEGKNVAEFFGGRFPRKITLSFSDRTNKDGINSFKLEYAERIETFIRSLDDHIDKVIVACILGRSRSAGIAAALVWYFGGDSLRIFEDSQYTPNPLCYRLLIDAFGMRAYYDFSKGIRRRPNENRKQIDDTDE